jgi:hypothetical protein
MWKALHGLSYAAVTEANRNELQEAYDRSRNDGPAPYHKAMDLAGIDTAFGVCCSRPILVPRVDRDRVARIASAHGLIIPLDNTELKKAGLFTRTQTQVS